MSVEQQPDQDGVVRQWRLVADQTLADHAPSLRAGPLLNLRRQLEHRKWQHGCAGPDRCVD